MIINDLIRDVRQTLGMEVVTQLSLQTAIENCFADIMTRGYKDFNETNYSTSDVTYDNNKIIIDLPKDFRKVNYLKIQGMHSACEAKRLPLADPRLNSVVENNYYRTPVTHGAIYYIRNRKIYLEFSKEYTYINKVIFGYEAKLFMDFPSDIEAFRQTEIPIREDYARALVYYCCYFYASRNHLPYEKTSEFLNTYKYHMEDMSYSIADEDTFSDDPTEVEIYDRIL